MALEEGWRDKVQMVRRNSHSSFVKLWRQTARVRRGGLGALIGRRPRPNVSLMCVLSHYEPPGSLIGDNVLTVTHDYRLTNGHFKLNGRQYFINVTKCNIKHKTVRELCCCVCHLKEVWLRGHKDIGHTCVFPRNSQTCQTHKL